MFWNHCQFYLPQWLLELLPFLHCQSPSISPFNLRCCSTFSFSLSFTLVSNGHTTLFMVHSPVCLSTIKMSGLLWSTLRLVYTEKCHKIVIFYHFFWCVFIPLGCIWKSISFMHCQIENITNSIMSLKVVMLLYKYLHCSTIWLIASFLFLRNLQGFFLQPFLVQALAFLLFFFSTILYLPSSRFPCFWFRLLSSQIMNSVTFQ